MATLTGIVTFTGADVHIGTGATLSSDGDAIIVGIVTATSFVGGDIYYWYYSSQIIGISTNNLVPFLFNNYSDLPSASNYHGQFAHVHVGRHSMHTLVHGMS